MAAMDAALSQIIDRVRDSAARQAPLCIRGGGTKGFHGPGAPRHAGEPLDMRPLAEGCVHGVHGTARPARGGRARV